MQQFYEMIGGAAATLLGLLFVSVSMNAEVILSKGHLHARRLAEQAFQNYLAILVISLFMIFPELDRQARGYTVLSISVIWAAWAAVRLVQTLSLRGSRDSVRTVLRRYLATLLGFGFVGWASFWSATQASDTVVFNAMGVMLLLISATVASWQLLVNIAEERFRAHKG